ncbi:Unknown protein [Striga hermonthica]|uniref:Uncharacterized protein n=1 Tax=Striga hermonthica TaxID=68872 RepID=A0A9N7NZD1_STRHE|nr:Unknown protein [Striga hermonthica]
MAMSRILSYSLHRSSPLCPPAALTSHRRHRSSKSRRGVQLAEAAEIEQSPTDSPEAAAEVITLGMKKLEDAIHSIIVRRSAPDWLPFLPGSSYWVPPRSSSLRAGRADLHHPARSLVDVIGKLSAARAKRSQGLSIDVLSEDENMAFTSAKGWPASSFYIEGTSPVHPIPVVEIEAKYQDDDEKENSSSSEDEDDKDFYHCTY